MRRRLRVPSWVWWSLAGVAFVGLILLCVLVFPVLVRPDLSAAEQAQLELQGTDKLVAAEDARSNAQNNVRATLLQGIAGAALLTGGYFAYRQLEATREGQITTRYTEAVKQLGDKERLEVRIGGIYALKRIAEDSKERDAPTIVDLLSAFVRTPRPPEPDARPDSDPPQRLSVRAPDVQIALTVMTGLSAVSSRIALRNAHLDGADLNNAHLGRADLRGAHLTDARLHLADLAYADLAGAHLEGAELMGAVLYGANLNGAHVTGADLTMANLTDDVAWHERSPTATNLSAAEDLIDRIEVSWGDLSKAVGTPKREPDGTPGIPRRDLGSGS